MCGTGYDAGTGLKAILQLPVAPAESPCIKPRSTRSEDEVQWTPRSCRAHQASDGMREMTLAQYLCSPLAKNPLLRWTEDPSAPQAASPRHPARHLMFAFTSNVCQGDQICVCADADGISPRACRSSVPAQTARLPKWARGLEALQSPHLQALAQQWREQQAHLSSVHLHPHEVPWLQSPGYGTRHHHATPACPVAHSQIM